MVAIASRSRYASTLDSLRPSALALIRADRPVPGLACLSETVPPSLLPIAGKPLLFFTLEDLAAVGFSAVAIAIAPDDTSVRDAVGDASAWGLTVEWLQTDRRATNQALRRRIDPTMARPTLILDAMVLRSPSVRAALAAAESAPKSMLFNTRFGVHLIPPSTAGTPHGASDMPLDLSGDALPVRTLADYHTANMRTLSGHLGGLALDAPPATGPTPNADPVKPRNQGTQNGSIHIGAFTLVDGDAVLTGRVSISEGCVIGPDTVIRDSVVLPNTHVGAGLHIENAVLAGSVLLRNERSERTPPAVPQSEPPRPQPPRRPATAPGTSRPQTPTLMEKGFAGVLLTVSLGRHPRHRALASVVAGRMRLIGTGSEGPGDGPQGAFRPSDLLLGQDGDALERRLTDLVTLARLDGPGTLRILARGWRRLGR
ncbi:NDP-sugar synthase [Roseospira marina]|uniref:NDP-sugar synthase n=1 Tax=Roseospira marina TaxID=140057 RepID=A0A5M6ICT2_9PROT|nr:NDP-sugar synthase [Roseospira marina]KAA5606071.1 NDP-sugar synthase [Roseospira marina]MBB4313064.1 hypothetical protein [Roseospira marina]MBB5086195.1 hypothetical protein [Roseospira marina]